MNFKKHGELILGIIIIVMGVIYFSLTKMIPRKGSIDATFVPTILSVLMFILGLLQVKAGYKKFASFKDEEAPASDKGGEKPDYATVLKTVVLIVLYVAFLDMIGFMITSALYLFAQFIVLTPVDKKKNYISYAVIAIISSVAIYYTFRNGLDLMLPEGLLY